MTLGQWRAFMPIYIEQVEISTSITDALLTDWQTDRLWKIELLGSLEVGVELS